MSADQELFESWFRLADRSGTGALGGGDAVAFFGKSGLSQATLFQVRERGRKEQDLARRDAGGGEAGRRERGAGRFSRSLPRAPIAIRLSQPAHRSGKPSPATRPP